MARPIEFAWQSRTVPYDVDETLLVGDDGTAWMWTLAALDPYRRDRAGTSMLALDDDLAKAAQSVAEELAGAADLVSETPRGQVGYHARVGDRTVALVSEGDGGTGVIARAAALGVELRERAEAAPLALVRLGWEGALSTDAPQRIAFTFTNPGVQPVTCYVELEGAELQAYTGNEWTPWWTGAGTVSLGLLDEHRQPREGVSMPAELRPDETLRLVCRDVIAPSGGPATVRAAITGFLVLVGLGTGESTFPDRRFELTSVPVDVVV